MHCVGFVEICLEVHSTGFVEICLTVLKVKVGFERLKEIENSGCTKLHCFEPFLLT